MLQIETHDYPNIGVIILKGNFVINEIKDFDNKIKNLKENYSEIGISFENVKFVDSAGLGVLVQLYKYLKDNKEGELYIYGASPEVEELFRYSQLSKFFKIMSKEDFRAEFIGYEYKMDFFAHSPEISKIDLTECESAKISLENLKEIKKSNNSKFYFEEDTNIYKRGKEINDSDIEQLEKRGYEFIWISSKQHKPIENSKEEIIRETRFELEFALSDFYTVFDEADLKKGSRGVLSYFSGTDLFKTQLDPLQREGAQKIYNKMFADNGKIAQIKTLLERLMFERITNVEIFSSKSIGSVDLKDTQPHLSKKMDEISNRLVTHSVNCAIMFIATCNRIFGRRAIRGQQVSVQRLEKGEKNYDKNKRSQYQQDLIINAAYGILFHDFGFNHIKLRNLLEKEIRTFRDKQGKYCKDSTQRLSEEERVLLKRHVHVAFNIMSSSPESLYASAIADNLIKFHHCFLDGNGYPDRKHYVENKKVKFDIPLHELTRLFSIINFYDTMLDRKPYRLPMRRETLVRYILSNSVPNTDPLGNPDDEGIWDIDTTLKQPGLFDGFLVKEFFKTINVYKIGESVALRNDKTGKYIPAIIVGNNEMLPNRPTINILTKGKWGKVDLSDSTYDDWYIDDLYETVTL